MHSFKVKSVRQPTFAPEGVAARTLTAPEPTPSPPPPDAPEPAAPADRTAPPAEFAALTEAEQYATLYPDRAARIRAEGGLPARLDFGPPEPEIVEAVVHGTSPILRALDTPPIPVAAE